MRYKLCKFCENRARDTPLRGVYIPDFCQIWVKISILGVLHHCRCADWGEIWHVGGGTFGPLLHAKFHPHRCNVSPLRGKKPQNWSLSKRNTGRFALPSWICYACVWATLEGHLVVFITVQNLVVIDAAVLIIWKFFRFCEFGLKTPAHALKMGGFGGDFTH